MVMSMVSNSVMPREAPVGDFLRKIGRTARNWWIAYINWRLEQFAIGRLRSMSDRELKDIGIPRSAIEAAVRGADRQSTLTRYH
jgi:uncharacterized protein YjiS (DUF1127 family)